VGDDFWANFIESDPEDPRSRRVTIYGSGSVNPNEGRPEVLLARLCSYVIEQPLCLDPAQQMAFVMLFNTARSFFPVALFSQAEDFLNFVEGKGSGKDLYPTLQMLLGQGNPLLAWTPVVVPAARRAEIGAAFITSAAIFTIQSTATVGRARARVSAVVNFDPLWVAPPMVSAKPPGLGVFHHYRLD
jgi:general secretion pathway protein K